jgi:8-oxo-dGTP pyrophosphatase MutT (NUDIX family)
MERVIIVDRENREVGIVPRPEMRAKRLPHRATYIFVFRSTGELVAQHRTATKDVYPSYIDLCAGGVVTEGESYEVSAERELAEEMGIRGVALEPHFDFWFEEGPVWGRAFSCVWDGEVIPQPEEVASVELISPEKALSGEHPGPFTPDSLVALRQLRGSTLVGASAGG